MGPAYTLVCEHHKHDKHDALKKLRFLTKKGIKLKGNITLLFRITGQNLRKWIRISPYQMVTYRIKMFFMLTI